MVGLGVGGEDGNGEGADVGGDVGGGAGGVVAAAAEHARETGLEEEEDATHALSYCRIELVNRRGFLPKKRKVHPTMECGRKSRSRGCPMYHHIKKLMYTVNIGEPNVRFGNMLLEQFGGANGELAAAMQYTIQGWNCVDDLAPAGSAAGYRHRRAEPP